MTNLKYLIVLAITACTMVMAQNSPLHPFPDDPEEIERQTCAGTNSNYNCIYLVNSQIDVPTFEDPSLNLKTVTRANGERIVITSAPSKGSITARCTGNPNVSSQIDFKFDRTSGNQADFIRGVMNAQYRSNWDRVVSKEQPNILTDVNGDDLRVYCTRLS